MEVFADVREYPTRMQGYLARDWSEPIRNAVGRLRPVKLDPAIVEAQMAKFVRMVGRVFQTANAEVPPESGLSMRLKSWGRGQLPMRCWKLCGRRRSLRI